MQPRQLNATAGGQQGLLGGTRGGKEVATRLRVENWDALLLGQISVWDRIKNARRRVEVGQKSRGSLLSYDEQRSQLKPSELPRCARVARDRGCYLKAVWGGSRG